MLEIEAEAAELADLFGTGQTVPLLTSRYPSLGLSTAYQIATAVRSKRLRRDGRSLGRKIGFTNHHMWERYGVKAPIWGYMYESSVAALSDNAVVPLSGFPEPKIEPEIVFCLGRAPVPGMEEAELLECIEWVALGFEMVSSIYPAWEFTPADAVAAYGLHFALRMGERVPIKTGYDWMTALASFRLDVFRNGARIAIGAGADVLGSPLKALRYLNDLLFEGSFGPPLGAGEIISTGTLTLAMEASPGDVWRAQPLGISLPPISLRLM
jgi:2-oxo-3-hexenedioate decarboxylase